MQRDLHDLESREIVGLQVRLHCYCGYATAFYDETPTGTATWRAAVDLNEHIVTAVTAELAGADQLIIIAGQSNAIGRGLGDDITNRPELNAVFNAVNQQQWLFTSAVDPIVWQTRPREALQPRTVNMAGTPPDSFGVELSLGVDLDAIFSGKVDLAKVAIGGTGLNDHWRVDAAYPVVPPNLFDQLIDNIQTAQTASGKLMTGLVWIQGEFDSNASDDANAYDANLQTFISTLRTTFGNFAFVFNQLSNAASAGPFKATVRAQQASAAAAIANCTMINVDDLALEDTLHFTADSYVTMGERFAAALIPLIV